MKDATGTRVSEIMTRNVRTIDVRDTVGDAIDALYEREVRHLPILDGDKLVGIMSDRDVRDLHASSGRRSGGSQASP